ncbi:TIGR03545 family protein [Thalassotalea sp. PLHSN55]|uniref:TIGR03545 family protein n=1 Tax=Thalassotalea sp. PLHSN55 TaxID=3435888 RepID=UPI003F844461
MSRYLRWQGLASFVVVILLIAAFIYLFIETLVKNGIEYGGSYYLGAEVNVESVEINYSPVELTVLGFQATDPDKPTTNLVSFAQATASVDVWQYLFGKVIIEDVVVDKLAFSSQRATPGKVTKDIAQALDEESGERELFSTPDISLPDPQTLLDNADLLTIKQGKLLEQTYHAEKEKLTALKAKLPSKEKLDEYKAQVKALSKVKVKSLADIEKLKADFDKIKQSFKADQAIVKQAKEQLQQSKDLLTEQTVALKNAPQQDWQNIESKYQLDKVDGADFAHMLFGEQARDYYDYTQLFLEKIKPLLSGNNEKPEEVSLGDKGRFVHFSEDNPLPDFLIKKAKISIVSPQGDFLANIEELNYQHWLRNKPTTYNVESTNLLDGGDARLTGDFSLNQENDVKGEGIWNFNQVQLAQVALQDSSKFSLAIEKAALAGKGNFSLNQGNIVSENSLNLSEAVFAGSGDSKVTNMVIDTFKAMDSLALGISATGPMLSPEFAIDSPLNNILKDTISAQLQQKLTGFKSQVNSGLNDKLASALSLNDDASGEILAFDKLLGDTDGALDELKNSDIVKQKQDELKDKAKDKVKDKLKGKLGDLFG